MKQNFINNCLLTLGTFLMLLSCNQSGNKEESATATDTTATTTTAMAEPVIVSVPDAVRAAPNLYKVLKDTAGIRVVEVIANAGDTAAFHAHPDAVLYVLSGGKAEFTAKDGTKQTVELKSGTISIDPAHDHGVKNAGTTPIKAILVEVNRSNNAGAALDAALDPAKVAPTLYKTQKDSMNIRVVMATYKAGASSAMHSHPDHIAYAIKGGTAEGTAKDGTKTVIDLPTGSAFFAPAGQHSIKNTGKSDMKILLVEVNRAAQ